MDYNAVTAWTGLGTALVAIYALWSESRRHRFSTSHDLTLKLEDQFGTQRMYRNRRKVAQAFLAGQADGAVNEIDEIVDFLDGVGYLVEKGAIDKWDAWACFFSYMYRFCHFAGDYIDRERLRDPTVWYDYIALYKKLYAIERRIRNRQTRRRLRGFGFCRKLPRDLPQDDLRQFLREEASLDVQGD